MRIHFHRAGSWVLAGSLAALLAPPALAASAFVRVNQVGYSAAEPKRAFLLASGSEAGAMFDVRNAAGAAVYSAPIGARLGSWSKAFPNVYALDFGAVTAPGTYTIAVSGAIAAGSPSFRIDTDANLFGSLIGDSLFFFETQRDGPDVIASVMSRRPSHLNDRSASTYSPPSFTADGALKGNLTRVGGPVDAAGGWFDAGDYIKFVQTHSYVLDLLLVGLRDFPAQVGRAAPAGRDFTAEARFGLEWLRKMWDDAGRTLYYQVGIGDGNGCGSICGDHDIWRLPQADDNFQAGKAQFRFIRNRPVFRAGAPGAPISPNLAGRLAAAFALGFQVFKASDPAFANDCLLAAEHVFDLANTSPTGELLSVAPHDFYPEDTWRDDLELGATELAIALAGGGLPAGLPHVDPEFYLGRAAHWAKAWIASPDDGADTLNLFDVSALAHYDLHRAIGRAGDPSGLEVSKAELLASLKRQLDMAVARANADLFGAGFALNQFDVTSHLMGLALSASFYDELTGTSTYAAFGRGQLAVVFGANAWGTSLVVGAGTTFPHCMQHQIANLVGSLDGKPPLVRGAAVNGPNGTGEFDGSGDTPDGARACPGDGKDTFARFTGQGGRFRDNVGAWMSVEPAIDFTASLPLVLSRHIVGLH